MRDLDVVIMLRLQKERCRACCPVSGITGSMARIAASWRWQSRIASSCIPGPSTVVWNRISSGRWLSVIILNQVTNGIAVRMAVMSMAMGGQMTERASRLVEVVMSVSSQPSRLKIAGGTLFLPDGRLEPGSLLVQDGRIAAVGPAAEGTGDATVIDAGGCIVAPGLVDLWCNLREPGDGQKGNITSETRAAAHGGFTTVWRRRRRPWSMTPAR